MITVNMHDAKTNLSKLVELAVQGEPFLIARAGKPVVRVCAVSTETAPLRIGFLKGEICVPTDFDHLGSEAIEAAFGGS